MRYMTCIFCLCHLKLRDGLPPLPRLYFAKALHIESTEKTKSDEMNSNVWRGCWIEINLGTASECGSSMATQIHRSM